jgi:nucleotide-binding universal stress UspA family protein
MATRRAGGLAGGRQRTAGRRRTASERPTASERRTARPTPAFARILVPVDFSSASTAALATATRLARDLGAGLVLLHVTVEAPLYSEPPFSGRRIRDVYRGAAEWARRRLDELSRRARVAGLDVRTDVRAGVPHREIVARANAVRAGLIVMGTHGRGGVERSLLGSVADRVVRTAPCPVLTVRGRR